MKGNDIMSGQQISIQKGGGTRSSITPPAPPTPSSTSSSNTQR